MWLVLCAAGDLAALWAARGLAARGLEPLEIVTPEAVAYALAFTHRMTSVGRPSVRIHLADGRVVDDAAVHGTLNRLQRVPTAHVQAANAADRLYAEQELHALYLSWLHGLLGPMLNRPTPQGLSGDWRSPPEWCRLAAEAGFATLTWRYGDAAARVATRPLGRLVTLLVVGDACCSDAPPPVAVASVRLARRAATAILGIDCIVSPSGDWLFSGAMPFPDLRLGGGRALDALAAELQA